MTGKLLSSTSLTPAQMAALPGVLRKLGLQRATLSLQEQRNLYERCCSLPFDQRNDLVVIEERMHLGFEILHAISRSESNAAIRKTPPTHSVRVLVSNIQQLLYTWTQEK